MNIPKLLGLKGKDLQLGDGKQTAKYIADKLKDGWVVLYGDIETIEMIENVVYTPGTERSEDFALIMGKILPDDETITTLYLAKKTDLFKQRIMYWCNINEEVYDRLVMINIVGIGDRDGNEKDGGVIWDYSMMDRENIADNAKLDIFVEHIVKDILKMEK